MSTRRLLSVCHFTIGKPQAQSRHGVTHGAVFEPVGPEDEDAAAQETDYVNHVFMQQNAGFKVPYSFIKDALLSKVGVVKVWWEEREEEQRETYYDITEDQFTLLAQAAAESDGALEIVAQTAHDGDGTPAPYSAATICWVRHWPSRARSDAGLTGLLRIVICSSRAAARTCGLRSAVIRIAGMASPNRRRMSRIAATPLPRSR